MPTWLQLACSLQPPCPSWHRSATGGRERVVKTGGRRGVGLPTSRPHPPAHLCTCVRLLHSPGCTHNCCPHGILPGVHRVVHTQPAARAAPHSVAQSSPHHRSRSRNPQGPHHSGHERCSGRLENGTGRKMELAHRPRDSAGRVEQAGEGQHTLAMGPKGSRGAEFTGCPSKPRSAPTLPTAAHAVHAHAMVTTGVAGAPRTS